MAKSKIRNQKSKDKSSKIKIKKKARRIRESRNVVDADTQMLETILNKYNIKKYNILDSEFTSFSTDLSNWRLENDGCIVTLKHESKDVVLSQNDRGSYHIQNVFYDFDYAVKSAVEHDNYESNVRYGAFANKGR